MLEAVEIIDDHDAHPDGDGGFDDCTNVLVHAESREEAKDIAGKLHDDFGVSES